MMRKIGLLVVLAAVIAAGWYFGSPYYAIYRLSEAVRDRDYVELEQRVDFAALRRSAAGEIVETARERLEEGNLLEDLRGAAVDVLERAANGEDVSRQDVVDALLTDRLAEGLMPGNIQLSPTGFAIAHQGMDGLRATSTYEDGSPGPVLLFTRDGLGWTLTGLDLP